MTGSADAPTPSIECRGLTRYYGTTRGIEDLDLGVRAGTVTGFLGPNGAGKTTVLRLLAGLIRPTRGAALVLGRPTHEPEARRALGFMPADPAFVDELTGRANLDLLAELQGADSVDRAHAMDLLEFEDAELGRPVGTYSSGMVQKLALVQAVQHRPEVVLLDEPANRLDPFAHHGFERLVREIAAAGRTVFLSSHVLAEVEAACDEVAMVRDGRLLMVATVAELSAGALRNVTISFRTAPSALPDGITEVGRDGPVVTARVEARRPDLLRRLLDDDAVEDLVVEPAPLEQTFLHLYRRDERARPGNRP